MAGTREEACAAGEAAMRALQAMRSELAALKLEVAAMREVEAEKQSVANQVAALQWEVASVREAAAAKQSLADEVAALRQQVFGLWELAGMRTRDVQRLTGEVAEMKRELAAVKGVIGSDEDESRDMWHPVACSFFTYVQILHCRCSHSLSAHLPPQKILEASQETELKLCEEASMTDAVLAHVAAMTRLSTVDLSRSSGFTTQGLQHLYALPSLTCLILYGTPVGGEGDEAVSLEGIGAASGLDTLILDHTSVADSDLEPLAALTSLTDLSLGNCHNLTPALLAHVGRLTGLEELSLGGCGMGDEVLPLLTCLPRLGTLTAPPGVTDAGLQQLAALPSLRRLSLCGCQDVTSTGMLHVGRLTSLQGLFLRNTRVTNQGLQHLTSLTNLLSLILPSGVTDDGMQLTPLTRLWSLDLPDGTSMDHEALLRRLGWEDKKRGG
ncbi:unnamed protein product [Closterium sp. Naga37s-1]|nr:unnamed protein product [Closterium sp. Naga37s-1]